MTPTLEGHCRELAFTELREKRLGLTQQYFEVHRVLEGESGPSVAGTVATENGLDVYFQLVDEPYFFVVCVIVDDAGPSVKFCRAEARCRVYLSVTSQTVPPEEVTAALQLTPTESWRRGDAGHIPGGLQRTFHAWYFDPFGDGPGTCDRKLKALLERLADASSATRELAVQCDLTISVLYRGYQCQMWGLSWSAEIIKRISALSAAVDVDIYASGPDLPD